jgi:hypothetical protein
LISALEEVGLDTKSRQPDLFYGAFCFGFAALSALRRMRWG